MINRLQGLKPQICNEHNQPIIQYQYDQPLCQICLNKQAGVMTIDQLYQKLNEIITKENKENEYQHQLLQQIWDLLISYQTNINKHLGKNIQMIADQIGTLKKQSQQFQQLIEKSSNQQKLIGELEQELIKIQQSNKQVRGIIENMLIEFKQKSSNIDQIVGLLKQNPVQDAQIMADIVMPVQVQIQQVERESQDILNEFEYQLIKEYSVRTKGCYAFDFNIDNNILVAGFDNDIIIYQFNDGKMSKELQRLNDHTQYITSLYFMKQSNGFVSGSNDQYSIIIWDNNNNQYFAKQTLQDHKQTVNCLLMNKKEDLMISGSDDKTIKFWKMQNGRWNCVQTIQTNNKVFSLNMNELENKLISCDNGSYILVYEIQQCDQQLVLAQKINTKERGRRLCFTVEDQFVFQPQTLDYLEVYNYDNLKKQFYKLKQIQIENCISCDKGFPCQYIRQLNILTVKHGNYLNIFRVNQDGNYELIQTIKYENDLFYGRMTDNGQYIVTWDESSKDIEIRKLIQMK